jgi:hypothetical protein
MAMFLPPWRTQEALERFEPFMPNLRAFKDRIPWWGKIAGQVIISRAPVSYRFWNRLGILEHGHMDDPNYAYGVFTKHFERVQFPRRSAGFVGMELGPGDSLFSAMIARAYGASAYYLVDAGDFAKKDLRTYQAMASLLLAKGLPAPMLEHVSSFDEVLKLCNATYGTHGLASLKAIPNGSVDFLWSHSVLQRIRRAEFFETLIELRRILRDDGSSSHLIDLSDQLANALNHLRFEDSTWESNTIARCGLYGNRFRYSEMLSMFRGAGFKIDIVGVRLWPQLPTARSKLDRQFQSMSEEELRVFGFEAVLTPA